MRNNIFLICYILGFGRFHSPYMIQPISQTIKSYSRNLFTKKITSLLSVVVAVAAVVSFFLAVWVVWIVWKEQYEEIVWYVCQETFVVVVVDLVVVDLVVVDLVVVAAVLHVCWARKTLILLDIFVVVDVVDHLELVGAVDFTVVVSVVVVIHIDIVADVVVVIYFNVVVKDIDVIAVVVVDIDINFVVVDHVDVVQWWHISAQYLFFVLFVFGISVIYFPYHFRFRKRIDIFCIVKVIPTTFGNPVIKYSFKHHK